MYLERIYKIDLDCRDCALVQRLITLKIQKTLEYKNAFIFVLDLLILLNKILLINEFFFLSKIVIEYDKQKFYIDYSFQSCCLSKKNRFSKKTIVRRFFDKKYQIRFLCQNYSFRDKLELREFIRDYFVFKFNKQFSKCLFLSLIFFIDRFDLYKNFYRSLIEIYFIIVAFLKKERSRISNILLLILDLYGSNIEDVILLFYSLF